MASVVLESSELDPPVRRAIGNVIKQMSGITTAPVGSVTMYAGTSAPTSWLFCDGSAVSRTTYSALFATLGTTFGVGDGSTTFNVPDMRGRAPIGVGTGTGLTARALAATVGTETHLLTGAQSGTSVHNHTQDAHNHTQNSHNHTQDSHNHTQNSHNHTQDAHNHTQDAHSHLNSSGGNIGGSGSTQKVPSNAAGGTGATTATNQAATATNQAATATNIAATATNQAATATNQSATATNQATAAADASQVHPNMQPSLALNFIIKY